MLAHRLRRRANIEPALGERLVFAWFFADGISLRKAEESDIMTIDTIWVVHFQRNYRADPEASQRFGQRRANVVWVITADNGYVPNVLYLGFQIRIIMIFVVCGTDALCNNNNCHNKIAKA